MKPTSYRWFLLSAAAFVAWLGWLTYLVVTASHPVVLSRPQFLAADLAVVAQIQEANGKPNATVRIAEVAWSQEGSGKVAPSEEIQVTNLGEVSRQEGWQGPGLYILPLVKEGPNYRLAAVPRSPGFEPLIQDARPRIYPQNDQTLRQLLETHPAEKRT
jgi:hypothetical protein